MYTKTTKSKYSYQNPGNYIEGVDIFNSTLLYKLQDPTLSKEAYVIKTDYRPDLIADEYYGDPSYQPFVILSAGFPLEEYTRGAIINLIPKSKLDEILNTL